MFSDGDAGIAYVKKDGSKDELGRVLRVEVLADQWLEVHNRCLPHANGKPAKRKRNAVSS